MVEWARENPGERGPDRPEGTDQPPERRDLDLDRVPVADPVETQRFLARVAYANAHPRRDVPLTGADRFWDLAVGAGLFLVALVLPLFRQSGTASWNTVWAEDGSIYAEQAIRNGGPSVLLRGYAGYLQLPPRLLALATPWFSLRHLALFCALAGVTVSALLAWFVYRMTRGWIASPIVRLVLASFLVLTPTMGPENTANMVNTIWVFVAAAPWALIALRERRRDTVVRGVVAFLAATASPLCVFYVPLAVVWVLIRRSRSAVMVAAAFGVGLVLQGLVILTTSDTERLVIRNGRTLRDGIGQRVFAVFLLGPKWASWLWLRNWRLSALGSTLVVLAILAALALRAGPRSQLLAAVFFVYSIVLFVVPVWGRGTFVLGLVEGGTSAEGSPRFDVVPVILLATAVAVLLGPVGAQPRRWVGQGAVPVFVAQVLVLMAVNFSVLTFRSYDRVWGNKVTNVYLRQCLSHPSDKLVTVPNNIAVSGTPVGSFPVTVPCRSLAP